MRRTYEAAVEVATTQALDVDDVKSALTSFRPDVGTSPRGWLEVRISLAASDLSHACSTALAVASAATGAEAIACTVMTESESEDRRSDEEEPSFPVQRMQRH